MYQPFVLLLIIVIALQVLGLHRSHHLWKRTRLIMSALDDLKAAVAAETTILGQAVTILDSIPGLIAAAQTGGNTDADLEALTAEITSQTASLKDSIALSGQGPVVPGPAPALSIDSSGVTGGQVGVSYTGSVAVSGGTAPYSVSLSGLPDGVSDNGGGAFSGTPSSAGVFSVSASASDSSSPSLSASDTFTVTIDKAP